jgi:hypothetical protein
VVATTCPISSTSPTTPRDARRPVGEPTPSDLAADRRHTAGILALDVKGLAAWFVAVESV